MKVSKLIKITGSELLTVRPQDRVVDIAKQFEQKHRGLAVVCDDDGRAVGVVSLGDIVHAIGERGAEALELPVRMLMTLEVVVCEPDEDLDTVVKRMHDRGFRYLPVVQDGKPFALIEERQALEVMYEEQGLDFAQLRNYVFKTGGRY